MSGWRTCLVTGSRAEYGLLRPLLRELAGDSAFDPYLAVTAQHLSWAFGRTVQEIESDPWPIRVRVELPLDDDSEAGTSRATAAAIAGFADAFAADPPDFVVVLGDRFETFGAATAAFLARVPLVHLYGGDLTFGALDDGLRHAITKLAGLHLTSTADSARRVVAMGEDPARVHVVGAIGLDNVRVEPVVHRDDLERILGFTLGTRAALVTFHPATATGGSAVHEGRELLRALSQLEGFQVLVTGSNADAHGRAIAADLAAWVSEDPESRMFVESLGTPLYLSAARAVDVVIGNSSSGLIEVPSLGTPTVDIGDRQEGRLRPPSVVHCVAVTDRILDAIALATSPSFAVRLALPNPYGDGHAAPRMARAIKDWRAADGWVPKRFHETASPSGD